MAAASNSLFCVAGKNVLITGGSRGIGLMVASGFASAGANVLLTSRGEDACRDAVSTLRTATTTIKVQNSHVIDYVTSNVATREGCKALALHVKTHFEGRLDVLVNNAGTSWGENPGYDGDHESGKMNWGWDKVLDLNVKGLYYLTRECVPLLQRAAVGGVGNVPDPGRVINIGSVAGIMPQEAPTHAYDVSKAAVHQLTKKMAGDLANRGITVNAIAPGFVPSRMSQGLSIWGADKEKISKHIPLGRMGTEEDMVGAAIYLSSRAGAWCTGVILNVDGGTVGCMTIPLSSL